jgi:hypothetical protein
MRPLTLITSIILGVCLTQVGIIDGQFNPFRGIGNIFSQTLRGASAAFGPRFRDDGTQTPVSTGRDQVLPSDCGTNTATGRGKLCFPDGKLCAERVNKPGIQTFGNHRYWFSWQDPSLANQKWDWFNARNYCRKRCMDLVSFETEAEYNWVKGFMSGVKYIWTSGRLCNFDGCDRRDFEPKNINGWFWSANQARLSPTNSRTQFHDWSQTGGFRPPRPQPDDREHVQQNGAEEACLAVLNNFYGDGIKWHDVACHHEKPIVCEDVEGHLAFARRTFPNIQIP